MIGENGYGTEKINTRALRMTFPKLRSQFISLAALVILSLCVGCTSFDRAITQNTARLIYGAQIKDLRSKHYSVRRDAARDLKQAGWIPKTASDQTFYYYSDLNWAALSALGSSIIPFVKSRLQDSENHAVSFHDEPDVAEVQTGLYQSLGALRTTAAISILVDGLNKNDFYATEVNEKVRRQIATTLDGLKWQPRDEGERAAYLFAKDDWNALLTVGMPAVPYLLRNLSTHYSDEPRRQAISRALSALLYKEPVEILTRWANYDGRIDYFTWNGFEVVESILQTNRSVQLVGLLYDLLEPKSPLRAHAADVLIKTQPAEPTLLPAFEAWISTYPGFYGYEDIHSVRLTRIKYVMQKLATIHPISPDRAAILHDLLYQQIKKYPEIALGTPIALDDIILDDKTLLDLSILNFETPNLTVGTSMHQYFHTWEGRIDELIVRKFGLMAVPTLLEELNHPHQLRRYGAIACLGVMFDDKRGLHGFSPEMATKVAFALSKRLYDSENIGEHFFRSGYTVTGVQTIGTLALSSLGNIGTQATVVIPAILDRLYSVLETEPQYFAQSLTEYDFYHAIFYSLPKVDNSNFAIALAMANWLEKSERTGKFKDLADGQLGFPMEWKNIAVSYLRKALASKGAGKREDELILLIKALGRFGGREAAPTLAEYLKNDNPSIRSHAEEAIKILRQ